MAGVVFDEASRIYAGSTKPAVDKLNLEIGDGEFLVLVGPSGCGKSTSLRMLAGLEDVDAGSIRIGDRDVTHLPPKDRDIAMVFQNYALYPHMTVAENMGFALKIAGQPKAEIATRVAEAAKLLDLEQYLERKPKALSGGQRQRVAMGRAIVRQPQVFLMDEPLSNLDAKLRVQTRTQIAALQRRLGVTTVYVTHDQVEAMTMGDRVAVLKDGLLQQVGTPRDLYDSPANVFVAGFIGSPAMNVAELPLVDGGAQAAGYTVPLSREVITKATDEGLKSVTVGFRPEDLVISDDGTGMPVLVNIVEELGADAYVYGELVLSGTERQEIIVRTDGRRPPGKGEVVHATVKEGHSHVFSPATGLRLSETRLGGPGIFTVPGPRLCSPFFARQRTLMALQVTAAPDEPDLLFLPWDTPLEQWPADQLVALPRGISRHVVRFVRMNGVVYAVKEVGEHLAVREYRLLRDLERLDVPSVEAVAVVKGRTTPGGEELDPALVTRHLQFSLPYRALFSSTLRADTANRLLDALSLLLVRLHLIGFSWNDCSLSNTLFRRDAGAFAAYLVDAETGELHPQLSRGQREHDLEVARINIYGELSDLEAGGMLHESIDALHTSDAVVRRYAQLWDELTAPLLIKSGERYLVDAHIRRLNDLGFDVAELEVITEPEQTRARVQPKVVDAGHHSRRLIRLTGLDVQENQARRLLNDLDSFRASLAIPEADEAVAAHRWVSEVFEPVVRAVPKEQRGKLEPAEIFHEVLEHRWFLSEQAGRDVGLSAAADNYVREVLARKPVEQAVLGERIGLPSDSTMEFRLSFTEDELLPSQQDDDALEMTEEAIAEAEAEAAAAAAEERR